MFSTLGDVMMKVGEQVDNSLSIFINNPDFDRFWDTLDKRKGNSGQECVKKRAFILSGGNWNNYPDFPGENDSFPSFGPTFPPVPS